MAIDLLELREQSPDPFILIQSKDGANIFLREWKSAATNNSVAIVILHGITAHSKPYDFIAKPLSEAGFQVFGLDMRGHGLSDGKRGDYASIKVVLNDLEAVLEYLNANFERVIILGHSMGVITSFFIINAFPDKINGLILLSAARAVREGIYPKPPLFKKLKILSRSILQPSKPVIRYYRKGMQGADDPLFNFNYSLRFMKIFNAKNVIVPDHIEIPVLVGVGDKDELFTVDSVKDLFDEVPTSDKEFIVIRGARHAVFPEGYEGTQIISWLRKHYVK